MKGVPFAVNYAALASGLCLLSLLDQTWLLPVQTDTSLFLRLIGPLYISVQDSTIHEKQP